jgi:hypothetical protein
VETIAITHRESGSEVLGMRHTYDLVSYPRLGETVLEVSTELLDSRGAVVANAEFFE